VTGRRAGVGLRTVYPVAASESKLGEAGRSPPQVSGPVAQLVERLAGSQEVRGSSPLGSTLKPQVIGLVRRELDLFVPVLDNAWSTHPLALISSTTEGQPKGQHGQRS
jgi:hypothetical protein